MTLDQYMAGLPQDCFFEPNVDLWARPEGENQWTIGANAFVTHYGRFVIFYPKPAGSEIDARGSMGVMETWKTAFGIEAPFACTILEGNERVSQDVTLAKSSPYSDGWLFKVKSAASAVPQASLLSYEQYCDWLGRNGERQFSHLLPAPQMTPYDPLVGM